MGIGAPVGLFLLDERRRATIWIARRHPWRRDRLCRVPTPACGPHTDWRRWAAAALVCAGIAGCGGAGKSTPSTVGLSPQQYENAQGIKAYAPAFSRILAPFTKPPASPTDIAAAERSLRRAIAQLKQLIPPAPFGRSHADLVRALEAELATAPGLAAALRSKAPITLNGAQARTSHASRQVREAISEGGAELTKCQANNFTC
jgi:hypothetical protein